MRADYGEKSAQSRNDPRRMGGEENGALGRHLRRLRQRRGLSQQAAASEIGCSIKSIQNWETGAKIPGPQSLRLLARYYGQPVEQLAAYIPDYGTEGPPRSQLERIEAKLDRLLAALERRR